MNDAADTLLDPVRRAAYDETLPEPEPVPVEQTTEGSPTSALGPRLLVALSLLIALTLAAAIGAVLLTVHHHDQQLAETARSEAPAAADRALPVVLAYDYRHLAADKVAAERYLSRSYVKQFDETFALLEKGTDGQPGAALQTKTVVTAAVVGTAVMDADANRVHVLAYVNQTSRHGDKDPMLFQNRVDVSMVKQNGSWLIDGLDPR